MTGRFDDEVDALKRGFRRRDARMELRWNGLHKKVQGLERHIDAGFSVYGLMLTAALFAGFLA